MRLTARDVMRREVRVVESDLKLTELERLFLEAGVTGFPVVDDGNLVGIVSRSDVVRQLCVEQSFAEIVSDYYRDWHGTQADPGASFKAIGDQVGERFEELRVRDVMIKKLFTVSPADTLVDVAKALHEHHIHRVPVTENGKLVGIITTLDFVRLVAEGKLSAG